LSALQTDFWSIGRLISISMGVTRVVGLVCEMCASANVWDEGLQNEIQVKIELVGEIVDRSTMAAGIPPRHQQLSLSRRRCPSHPRG
jgi:hypothetical protein